MQSTAKQVPTHCHYLLVEKQFHGPAEGSAGAKTLRRPSLGEVKVKVNVDLYSASS